MSASETIIWTARTSSPTKASADSSARPARSESTAITIPCARICGWPRDQAFKAAVENYSKKQAFMSRLAKAPSIPDFSAAPPNGFRRTAARFGLDHAKLGAGSQNRFRGTAPVPATVQLARHLSPDLHDELSAQQRRNQDSRQSQPRGDRSQPRNRIGRWHGAAQFLRRLSPPPRSTCPRPTP